MRIVERLTGGQAVVRALEANGVEVVFGIPGVHTLDIYDALLDSPIRHVLARHEQGVGFMADGYARASGRPGVALVITGPGVTNVATPVGEAYADSSPVLVVASSEEQRWAGAMDGHYHDLRDQFGLMAPLTAWSGRATAVGDVPRLIGEAFRHMMSGRTRPTYVQVPLDVLGATDEITTSDAPLPSRVDPAPAAINQAVESIAGAERIVLYCGGGAAASGAQNALVAVAERLGAPVVTSETGKGSIPEDHPLAVGNLWERGNAVDELLRRADLALVLGSKLGASATDHQAMPLPSRLIRVDVDPLEVERHYRATQAIVADARATAAALVTALAARGISKQGWTADQVAAVKHRALGAIWGAEQAPYLAALRRAVPRDGVLTYDMTMMGYLAARRYPVYEPRTFFGPTGYGTLGFALPAALGAKVARPEATVVAVVGDGGFQYTMQELATAVQFRLGVPIVVFNDSTYTAVKMDQALRFDRRYIAVDLVNPDFLGLAAAYGIPGVRADSPDELEAAVVAAAQRDLPTIIDTPMRFEY